MNIALDLGGTNLRGALVDRTTCLNSYAEKCLSDAPADVVIGQMFSIIDRLMSDEVESIGIGVPCIVDTERGILYNATNIPSLVEVPLRDMIQERYGLPTAIDNDCNCYALGEYTYGAGRGSRNMVGITLGTGVGAGVIINGHPYRGLFSGAGEIGALPYLDSDYEHYCSSMHFRHHLNTTAAAMAARAENGNPECLKIWNDFGYHMGALMMAIMLTYAPDRIVIGGGIARAFDLFAPAMRARIEQEFLYPIVARNCSVVPGEIPEANLIGASILCSNDMTVTV